VIRVRAFSGCRSLKDVYVECATLPDIPGLGGIKPEACTLHVPAGTASLYRDAKGYWSSFKSIEEMPASDAVEAAPAETLSPFSLNNK
jgi:hypothetical protein